MIEPASPAVVFVLALQVTAFGADHLVIHGDDGSVRRAFVNRQVCDKQAERLTRVLKGSRLSGVDLRGVKCIPMEVLK